MLAAVACAAAMPPVIASVGRCWSAGSRTIVVNEHVRVFSTVRGAARAFYGCADGTYHGVGRFRAAGTLVAHEQTSASLDGSPFWSGRVVVRDLAARRAPRRLAAGAIRGLAYAEQVPTDGVRDLVVDAAGDVAWIVQNPGALPQPPPGVYKDTRTTEVYVARRASDPVLLDQGDAIVHSSLTRNGCTISWAHGSTRRTARLCPERRSLPVLSGSARQLKDAARVDGSMPALVVVLVLVVWPGVARAQAPSDAQRARGSVHVDGVRRTYSIFVPASPAGGRPYDGVAFVLHGGGRRQNGEHVARAVGFDAHAQQHNWIARCARRTVSWRALLRKQARSCGRRALRQAAARAGAPPL